MRLIIQCTTISLNAYVLSCKDESTPQLLELKIQQKSLYFPFFSFVFITSEFRYSVTQRFNCGPVAIHARGMIPNHHLTKDHLCKTVCDLAIFHPHTHYQKTHYRTIPLEHNLKICRQFKVKRKALNKRCH